jgi:DMSO/TMAO reductase YedYZ molybdopterin-dependent catalytic subunit
VTAPGPGRRSFVARVLAGLGLLGLARATDPVAARFGRGVAHARETWTLVPGLSTEVTPVGRFYTVSKNVFDPAVDARTWRLAVKGKVDRPYHLTLDDLRRLPAVTKPHTLMCISNEVGGDLISNAWWTGVPLRVVLESAGVQPGATKVVLRGRDGYSDSLPLTAALLDGTIVAYEMNGKPLERQHGFPARVLAMGLYGIKNVKWLAEVEVVDSDYKGYWQRRGWTDTAVYKTFSRIDVPGPSAALPRGERRWIAGVAFAGHRGVGRVELSMDGGRSWQPARLKPAMGDHTWILWAVEWTPPVPGRVTLMVRAVDGRGAVQPAGPAPPLPDGVEGFHSIETPVA